MLNSYKLSEILVKVYDNGVSIFEEKSNEFYYLDMSALKEFKLNFSPNQKYFILKFSNDEISLFGSKEEIKILGDILSEALNAKKGFNI